MQIIIGVLVLVNIIILAAFVVSMFSGGRVVEINRKYSKTLEVLNKEKVCLTEGCVKADGNMLMAMDLETDPCEDFYGFAADNSDLYLLPFPRVDSIMSFEKVNIKQIILTVKGLFLFPAFIFLIC